MDDINKEFNQTTTADLDAEAAKRMKGAEKLQEGMKRETYDKYRFKEMELEDKCNHL